jgi:hypothetical protein
MSFVAAPSLAIVTKISVDARIGSEYINASRLNALGEPTRAAKEKIV